MEAKKIFNKVDIGTLHDVYITHTKKTKQEVLEIVKKKIVDELLVIVEAIGTRHLASLLLFEDLSEICSLVNIDFPEKSTKHFLAKRLVEKVERNGFEDTTQNLKKDHISVCLAVLGVDKSSDLKSEVIVSGLQAFLSTMRIDTLKSVCNELGIYIENPTMNNMIAAITVGKLPSKKSAPQPVKISKNKPKLRKGVILEDILHHYYKDELEAFCREHGLLVSGKKRDLTKRIIEYLNNASNKENSSKLNQESKESSKKKIAEEVDDEDNGESVEEQDSEEETVVEKNQKKNKVKEEEGNKGKKGSSAKEITKEADGTEKSKGIRRKK